MKRRDLLQSLPAAALLPAAGWLSSLDRKSTRLNSSHGYISYAVFCLKKKKIIVAYMLRSSSILLAGAYSLSAIAVAASVASCIFPGAGRAETKIVVGLVSLQTTPCPT